MTDPTQAQIVVAVRCRPLQPFEVEELGASYGIVDVFPKTHPNV